MRSMLDIAYDYLTEQKREVDFTKLFDYVASESKALWKERFPHRLLKDIHEDKAAEFYTWLSIDGRFIRNRENAWSLVENYTFAEVEKMRVDVSETLEAE